MIFFFCCLLAFYVTDRGTVCCVDRYRYTILYIDGRRYIVFTLKNSSIDSTLVYLCFKYTNHSISNYVTLTLRLDTHQIRLGTLPPSSSVYRF